jgi:hypothetical protein
VRHLYNFHAHEHCNKVGYNEILYLLNFQDGIRVLFYVRQCFPLVKWWGYNSLSAAHSPFSNHYNTVHPFLLVDLSVKADTREIQQLLFECLANPRSWDTQ